MIRRQLKQESNRVLVTILLSCAGLGVVGGASQVLSSKGPTVGNPINVGQAVPAPNNPALPSSKELMERIRKLPYHHPYYEGGATAKFLVQFGEPVQVRPESTWSFKGPSRDYYQYWIFRCSDKYVWVTVSRRSLDSLGEVKIYYGGTSDTLFVSDHD